MVKKVALFTILLVSLISIAIIEQIYVSNTIKTMDTKIHNMQYISQKYKDNINSDTTIKAFVDLQNYWESREGTMALFIDHKNIANVGLGLARLKATLEENDYEMAKTEIYQLEEIVFVFKKLSAFSIHNVL